MKRKYHIALIFAFILVSLIGFVSTWLDNGELTQNVDGCNILNTTGATYTLTQNVSSTGTCFTVTSSNVVLDCNGHWINYEGTGSENAYGLYTNQFNTTLRNCNIYNYTIGAYYHGASNGTIQNNIVQVYHNRSLSMDGIVGVGMSPIASGILLYDSADYNLIINTTSHSQYGRGIYLNKATNNTIINSSGTSNSNPGIQIYTNEWDSTVGHNNTVLNSYAYSNSDIGLLIGWYGGWNEVINSTIISNSSQGDGYALATEYSKHNKIINTTGHASHGYGIMILAGENTLILNSTGKSNSGSSGISLYYSTVDSVIVNSTGISDSIHGGCGIIVGEGAYSPSSNITVVDSTGISVGEKGSGICIGGFNNTIIRSTAIGERAYYFGWNATDILVEDCVDTNGSMYGVYAHRDWDMDITFLNCSYGYESILSAYSNLTRKWYYQAYVNDTFGNPLSNVNVTAYNSTGHLQFTQQTDSIGLIDRQEVIDYINRGGRRTSYNDYTIGAYLVGHPPAKNHIINFGNINNKVDDWFTIKEPDFTPPLITIISPIGAFSDVTPLINVSLSEEARVWYSVDEGENITLCKECDFSYDKFLYSSEGEHIFRVFANDSSGNFNTTFVSFAIDMNYNYYDDFEDNSSILSSNDVTWGKGSVSFKKGFNYLEDPNLVSAYLFNDSDNLGFDLKGNNHMYEVIGSPSRSSIIPPGKTGHSIYLDGNSEICISSGFTFNPSEDNTMCFWAMKEEGGNVFAQTCIYDTWGDYPDYIFTANNCGSLNDEVTIEGVFEIDRWVHICQTYDSTNNNFSIYVDGTENISKVLNLPIEYSLDLEWCIGGFYEAGFMTGNVFEPMWFNRQLNPDEINFIYSGGNYYSSGNFTSYPVNTTEDIFRITNVSWTEVNTSEENNVTIQVSADGGENWYNSTSGEGLKQNFAEGNNSLVYRVIFSTIDSFEPVAITSMNISWGNKVEIPGENICGVLDEEGKTYVLTGNVSSSGTCFTVTSPNVVLDCNGHWINYSTSGDDETYGVYSNQFNTTIKNCNIVDGNPSSENKERKGILLEGESHFANIFNNNITTSKTAINLRGVNNTLLVGNFLNATDIRESAIHLHSSCKNTLVNNTLYGGDYVLNLEGQEGEYLNTQDNLFMNNRVFTGFSEGCATLVQYASNNTFINESYYTSGGINVWLAISHNNLFRDCAFTGEDSDPIDTGWDSDSINNTFVNCTYNEENVKLPFDEVEDKPYNWFLTKWYYQTYVNDTNGNPLSNVNITAYNRLGLLEFTALTDENGRIALQDITNYNITSKSGTTYFSNYTISAVAEGYESSNKQLNITLTKNKLNDFFTLESTGDIFLPNIIFQEPPTPENTSIVSTSNVTIVANISDASITSSWIDLDRSLVGYWGMDSFNASGVYDNSSYNNFGTFEGDLSPSDSVEGVRGRGIKFDGVDDYISVNDIQNMGQKFTISIWSNVFGNSSGGEDYWGGMFTEYNGWGTDDGSGLLIGHYFSPFSEGSGMITTARIGNYSDIWREDGVVIDEGYPLNTWRHYVIVWDYPYLSVYLNGEVVDSIIFNYQLNPTWSNIKLGMMLWPDWFNGSLDEVMIFNRSLSQTEILALYNSQSNLFNATFDDLEFGQHNYTIYAVDEYGNIANSGLRNFILNEDKLVPGENACGVLDEEGKTYVLTENVSSIGTCFEITADDITLDCNGHWINYSQIEFGYGVDVSECNGTRIKNCNIVGGVIEFSHGILLDNSNNSEIFNNFIFTKGVVSDSISLYTSNFTNIYNNTLYNYEDRGHSIYSRSSTHNTVSNLIIYAHHNGIYLEYDSHNWSISNLSVFVNNSSGIVLDVDSDNILLNNLNVTSNNGAIGVFINSSLNNISNVNIYSDLNSSLILNGIGNNILNSIFYSNSEYSVYLVGGKNNSLINNTFLGAKKDGSFLRILESSGNNLFYWNNFTETEGYFINNSNDSNKFNTTISGTPQGNYYFGISNKKIYDSNNNGWGDKGSEYPINSTNWEEKWIGDGADYGPSTSRKEDLVSPTFTEVSHTDNVAGESSWFRINISDNIGLHPNGGYIFSTNNSGLWVNDSFVSFTSTPHFVNLRKVLNSNVGRVIGYRWYFNDSFGNNASTPIYTLTTQEKKVGNSGSGGGGGGSETSTGSGEENPLFKPTYKQMQEGYELVVLKGYLILVNLSEKGQHLLEIAKIDSSTGVVQVLINSSSYFIDSDESVKIDLTGDNNYDLEMSVLSVSKSNSSRMRFKEIHEEMDPLDVPVNGNNSIDNKTVIEVFGGRTKIRLSKYVYVFSITLLIILILLVGYFIFKRIKKFGH